MATTAPALADEFDEFDHDDTAASAEEGGESSDGGNSTSEIVYEGSTASEFANDEEYAEDYAQYRKEKTSKAEINRQRTEGFARTILLGVRGSLGINTLFGQDTDGWGIGLQGSAGLLVQIPVGIKNLHIVPELVFAYRHYSYTMDTEFGDNDASVSLMMFEIPLILRYTFVDWNLFAGLGLNLGLKLTGSSEFNQNMDLGDNSTRTNTIPTTGFELGAALDLGYILTRWVHINVRVVQGFTNLLNTTTVAEMAFKDANFLTFYVQGGVSFLF